MQHSEFDFCGAASNLTLATKIMAGDLGVNLATVEYNLNDIFKLSSAWNPTPLSDEADV